MKARSTADTVTPLTGPPTDLTAPTGPRAYCTVTLYDDDPDADPPRCTLAAWHGGVHLFEHGR